MTKLTKPQLNRLRQVAETGSAAGKGWVGTRLERMGLIEIVGWNGYSAIQRPTAAGQEILDKMKATTP